MKKILTLIFVAFASVNLATAQDCDLPLPFTGNTGTNMTIMLTPAFMSSLPGDAADAYMVALNTNGEVVGSAIIGGMDQNSLAVWGDDTQTDEVDGAIEAENVSFQLVDGSDLYDVIMPSPVIFSANAMSFQTDAATSSLVDCSVAEDVLGCMDSIANNYNPDATLDDESCTYDVLGCMDSIANNYNAAATVDDASCTYDVLGCMDSSANNYNADATVDDASCTYDVLGCMDSSANNYNADATVDDGSCEFTSSSGEPIEYQLSSGWNMVGYTGTADNNGIVDQMDAALGNGAGTANTFQVIKNVSGQFWSAAFAQISTFTQGQGYMMYVIGDATTVNFQQSSGYISGITYQLSSGWNMVAFTGDVDADNDIVSSMDNALGNGAGTANTFQVIKNVSGQFWSAAFAQISTFNPGQAYMMYVIGDATTVNFQQ